MVIAKPSRKLSSVTINIIILALAEHFQLESPHFDEQNLLGRLHFEEMNVPEEKPIFTDDLA